MGRKTATSLAKERNMSSSSEFYDHIINSGRNGQYKQLRSLFSQMKTYCQHDFILSYLDNSDHIHLRVKDVCIDELFNKLK